MPVPAFITDLSQTPASNSPAGSESAITADNYLRQYAAFIRMLLDATISNVYTSYTTAGTSTAYTITPSPAITAYAANQSFFVTFNATCGAAPTLAISGLATPPNLVKQLGDGTFANIAAGEIPINHRSRVTLLSAAQALVEELPFAVAGPGNSQLAGMRNKIINGNFAVNQRAVASASTAYAAGAYTLDRWKAGAGGVTLSFATVANVTTITITAGTLVQVIEGNNLQSGTHALSWTGTAQGRIDGGAYGASGLTGAATGGTNMTVEFNTGTLSLVQLEPGAVKTPFEHRLYGAELALCRRYYVRYSGGATYAIGQANNATAVFFALSASPMRTTPTASYNLVNCNDTSVANAVTAIASVANVGDGVSVQLTTSGMTTARAILIIGAGGTSFLDFSAEL